jgi:hypothetical protein
MHSLTSALDGDSFRLRQLYPQGMSPRYSFDRRLGGPQSRSGCGGEEKNSQSLPGLEPPIIQPVAQCYTTELSRFTVTGTQLYTSLKFSISDVTPSGSTTRQLVSLDIRRLNAEGSTDGSCNMGTDDLV